MNRTDFPILSTTIYNRPLTYLDNAATTQKPQCVLDAITNAYTHWNANIHRGVHHLSQVATQKHEDARQYIADFLGAKLAKEIIFTKGTTDSLNTLAFSFGEAFVHEGDEIVVSCLEHHSNIVPWQMMCKRKGAALRVIPLLEDLTLDIDVFADLLTPRTKLVCVTHVSNVLGTINPVEQIIQLAHNQHIPVCIDGAQSAPHLNVDMQALNCDFYVCSAHKIYGPTGLGILYGKEEWLNQLPPAEGGGEMIEHVTFERTTYNTLPYKFEAGTPNFIGSYVFAEALRYVEQIGRVTIEQHEEELARYAESSLAKLPGVHIYSEGQRKAGAISFNVYRPDGQLIHPFDVGTLLDHQGVAVRTGHHCAEPLINHLGIPGTVRASFALYTDHDDIDRLTAALVRTIDMLL